MGGGKNPLMQKIRKIDNSWKSFNTRTIERSPVGRNNALAYGVVAATLVTVHHQLASQVIFNDFRYYAKYRQRNTA